MIRTAFLLVCGNLAWLSVYFILSLSEIFVENGELFAQMRFAGPQDSKWFCCLVWNEPHARMWGLYLNITIVYQSAFFSVKGKSMLLTVYKARTYSGLQCAECAAHHVFSADVQVVVREIIPYCFRAPKTITSFYLSGCLQLYCSRLCEDESVNQERELIHQTSSYCSVKQWKSLMIMWPVVFKHLASALSYLSLFSYRMAEPGQSSSENPMQSLALYHWHTFHLPWRHTHYSVR
jgi:hypothetical protein